MERTNPTDAETDRSRVLELFVRSYCEVWRALIREVLQNSGDAQGQNVDDGVIPEDREVNVVFNVNTDNNNVEVSDNAGGMLKEVLSKIVVSLAGTTKEDVGSGGGQFGIGLWILAYLCDEEDGGLYIETKHEETGDCVAAVLYPDGKCMELENGSRFGDPEVVQEQVNLDIESTTPREWEEGGTFLKLDNVKDEHMEKLSNMEMAEEEMYDKFAILSDQFNVEYNVDDKTYEFDPTTWDDFKGEVIRTEEGTLEVSGEDCDGVIDKLVFFEVESDEGVPWGNNIPLVKTRPGFDNPHMIVRDFNVPGASSVVSEDGGLAAYAVVDSLADDYEKIDHASFDIIRLGDKVDIGEVAKEVHMNQINVREDCISEEEIIESCENGVVKISESMKNTSGDVTNFGVDYKPHGKIEIEECDDFLTIRIEKKDQFTSPESVVEIEEMKWGNNETVNRKKMEVNLEESREIEYSLEREESPVRVRVIVREKDTGKKITVNSTGINVDNLGKSGIHRKGGFAKESIESKEKFLNEMNITGIEWTQTKPKFCVEEDGNGGYVLEVNENAEELREHLNLSNERKSRRRQKRLFMKEAALSILDKILYDMNSDEISSDHRDFKRLREELENIPIIKT